MTQGGHDVLDLDPLVVSRSLKPQTIRLGGREWTLKRDFTSEQVVDFWQMVSDGQSTKALCMLVGDTDGPAFAKLALALPTETGAPILRRIYQAAGMLKRPDDGSAEDGDKSGES
ncbi:MAG: hypothetical protein K0Q93_2722 [Nocardioidaceae bacterium]|jgi:hypothetical protein|nr:hypothetical protein [Nocardioidaceae bacterium]